MLMEALGTVAKLVFWLGLAASALSIGFLVYLLFAVNSGATAEVVHQAQTNVGILEKVAYFGLFALGVGMSFLWWGEQITGPIEVLVGAGLFTTPIWLTQAVGTPTEVGTHALAILQAGGAILGSIGVVTIVGDIAGRTRDRVAAGARAEQLKYGKGTKEEPDRRNVFMGSCWQLPFCRKFVREKCPIYHSKRTCWKELVGCMCEESVIRGAMENRPIPKNALLAAEMIPRNNKLTFDQKRERCKSCVIYNEHQRHKYRAAIPALFVLFAGIYLLLRIPLLGVMQGVLNRTSNAVHGLTLSTMGGGPTNAWMAEGLLVLCFLLAVVYCIKLLEYLIFVLKV